MAFTITATLRPGGLGLQWAQSAPVYLSRAMLRPVDTASRPVWDRMIQAYEYEFSRLTGKAPLGDGTMPLDTELGGDVHGWIWWEDGVPAGFAAAVDHGDHREVAEFYMVPRWRRQGLGVRLAAALFDTAPGPWTVKQLANADDARTFWRSALAALPCRNLSEDAFDDPYWGRTTRQRFSWDGGTVDAGSRGA